MKSCISYKTRDRHARLLHWPVQWMLMMTLGALGHGAAAQDLQQKIQGLTEAMARTQAQLEQSQRQLEQMRSALVDLQRQVAESQGSATGGGATTAATQSGGSAYGISADLEELRERQAMQESQIATHEQAKVESASKYPVKLTGLVLFNSFVNTRQVDMPATPTLALPGPGSTGASMKQTILGFDAQGPHLLGAQSYADLRIDFAGTLQSTAGGSSDSTPYAAAASFLRLRTAHAGLQWGHTVVGFSLDRPILSPEAPTSLTAVAEPALAWSGNLWTWNPQVGVTHDVPVGNSTTLRLQSALIDVGDAPYSLSLLPLGTPPVPAPSSAEQSRWPGVQSRIALLRADGNEEGNRIGVGGYFSPHRSALNYSYDAWATSVDTHVRLPLRFQLSGSGYRGAALGGLGGGAYKDFAYRSDADTGGYYFRALDDVGGWAQLKEKFGDKIQVNAAAGLDELFAHQMRRYAVAGGTMYQNLLANRTYAANVLYSPSAYLLFSLEYRHLQSTPITGAAASSDVIGIAAGYKF